MVSDRYLKMSNADPEKQRAKLLARREISDTGCWEWPGQRTAHGYGTMRTGPGSTDYVHRISHRLFVGPIPDGLAIDHLCRNRICYNPEHLEVVTHRENVARGYSPGAVARRENRCKYGHDMTDAYVKKATGHRQCRTCALEWQRRPENLAKRRERERAHRARGARTSKPEPSKSDPVVA